MFGLEIQTLHCKLKPPVNRLNLTCPMFNTSFLFSFFSPFFFFPCFLMIPPKFFPGPRDLLVKTLFSKTEDWDSSFSKKSVFLFLIERMWAYVGTFDIRNFKFMLQNYSENPQLILLVNIYSKHYSDNFVSDLWPHLNYINSNILKNPTWIFSQIWWYVRVIQIVKNVHGGLPFQKELSMFYSGISNISESKV